MDLGSLIALARTEGWAEGSASMAEVRYAAYLLGLETVPNRATGPGVTTLRPVAAEEAHPNSLSAQYGKGDQPLHTDGAHLSRTPDVVILACEGTSQVPTRLWRPARPDSYHLPPHVRHGVFLVSGGRESFFSTAFDRRFRFDPGCMVPCDARARQTVSYFAEAWNEAVDFGWDKPNKVLVIDNAKTLHARAAAEDEPGRELQRVSFYLKEEQS